MRTVYETAEKQNCRLKIQLQKGCCQMRETLKNIPRILDSLEKELNSSFSLFSRKKILNLHFERDN